MSYYTDSPGRPPSPFSTTVTVPANVATQVGECLLKGDGGYCAVEVLVDAAAGTNTVFKIQAQFQPDGEWHDYLTGTDFDAAAGYVMLRASSTGPHEVAPNGKGYVIFRVEAIYKLRFLVTNNSGGDVTVNWSKRKAF